MITPKINNCAQTINGYYQDYNHIMHVPYPSKISRLWNETAGDSFYKTIYTWANEHLKGTMTANIHRVMKMTDGGPKEWHFNEFGHDEMFAAFESEEDAVLFSLMWI